MSMRFGIWDWMDRHHGIAIAEQYAQRLTLLEQAERAGFWCYHLAEHHATPLSVAPSTNLFFAALAGRTSRLRFGPLVYLLPFYHPLRLAEEICMLDQLSHGRLEVGVGRGTSPYEMTQFGLVPDEAASVFRESLSVLAQALRGGAVDHAGEHYAYHDVRLSVAPYQRPYPPLWYPTTNPDSLPWAAREGFHTVYGFGFLSPSLDDTRAALATYRRQLAEAADAPDRLNGHVREPLYGVTRHVYLADTDRQARDEARDAFAAFFENFNYLFAHHGSDRYSSRVDYDALLDAGMLLIGSPATVRQRLLDYTAAVGANYFAGSFFFGNLSVARMQRSLHLFATEVMPAFQSPGAATGRQG